MKTHMQQMLHDQLLLAIVQRDIFCVRSGKVLDVRTCVVFVDSDGDPAAAFGPEAYPGLLADGTVNLLANRGFTVDPTTVPSVDTTL